MKKVFLAILIISLAVSLWFNFTSFRYQQHVQSWKEYTYNQFVGNVITGGRLLGYQLSSHEPKKAALNIGQAAILLKQWSVYCDTTGEKAGPHRIEVANYLSYVALILTDPNQQFENDDAAAGEKYIKDITKLFFEQLSENGGAFSGIPDEKESGIFNEMYRLIPKDQLDQVNHFFN